MRLKAKNRPAEFNKKRALLQYNIDRVSQNNRFLREKLSRMENGSNIN